LINGAEHSLDVAVNVLSYPPVVEGLVAAQRRGVRVRVLLGIYTRPLLKSYDEQVWAMREMAAAGVEIWLLDPHHQKMMVIDDRIVETGSPGYDANPLIRNHDNYVIVKSEEVAILFKTKIEEMIRTATPYSAADWETDSEESSIR